MKGQYGFHIVRFLGELAIVRNRLKAAISTHRHGRALRLAVELQELEDLRANSSGEEMDGRAGVEGGMLNPFTGEIVS
jgi:hypothetical protein